MRLSPGAIVFICVESVVVDSTVVLSLLQEVANERRPIPKKRSDKVLKLSLFIKIICRNTNSFILKLQ